MRKAMLYLVPCLLAVSLTYGAPFNCLRSTQSCPEGATCKRNGKCQCPSTLRGDDCSIVKANTNQRSCRYVRCRNGGICERKNGKVRCACTIDYYGADCSLKRYDIKCQNGEMLVNVNPVGSFSGVAFVEGKGDKQACQSFPVPVVRNRNDGIPDEWEGYVIRVAHTSKACGSITATLEDNKYVYRRKIFISYDGTFVTTLDDIFTGKCEMSVLAVVSSKRIQVHERDRGGGGGGGGGGGFDGASLHHESAALFTVCLMATLWRQRFESWL